MCRPAGEPPPLGVLMQMTVQFLAPVLPYLVAKAGDVAAAEAIKKVGKQTWGVARRLWEKLRPAVEASSSASEAVKDLADHPDVEDYRAVLRVQLKKLLEADRGLADEVARLIEEGRKAGPIVTASGDRSVAAGGDISGTVVTGDRNIVKRS